MDKLTHFKDGKAVMVDVGDKDITKRTAIARTEINMSNETFMRVKEGTMKKGDVLGVARVAGIMAAKQTSNLIPMCHPLLINSVEIEFCLDDENSKIVIEAGVKISGKTGVEMEALTAASITALTIYDMCKAMDKDMVIGNTYVVEKSGGKSGHYIRK